MLYLTSKENSVIKHIGKLISNTHYRAENAEYVIEGIRLCKDALLSNVVLKKTIYSQTFYNKNIEICAEFDKKSAETYVLTDSLFKVLSDTKNPQGIMCLCKIIPLDCTLENGGNYIALQDIQDPSNMGTILRTAEALGIDGIFIFGECCDIYSPKVLRGSMGAVFRLPISKKIDIVDYAKKASQNGFSTLAAVPEDGATNIKKLQFKGSVIAFIGNEGNGLTQDIISVCTHKITIPMKGKAESLNAAVAASIIMWELLK